MEKSGLTTFFKANGAHEGELRSDLNSSFIKLGMVDRYDSPKWSTFIQFLANIRNGGPNRIQDRAWAYIMKPK